MPERIGAYRLESPLGRGGMGEVFLAWDERLERAVAIKRIRHDAFVEGHQRERFRREARMAARLSHAAIVQVHDLVSEESGDAIVMEYVEGLTLAERLTRGPLGVAEAIQLAKEIAEGLAAAHEAGLIHRDLKAENVVITPAGHAKILDFGLARPVCWDGEMLTQHGALIGTCYAMSPEQASGGDLDERSDLFALGALLYEMLAGCSAFRAKDPQSTLRRVLYEQPPALAEIRPNLSPALVSLVERLLAKDRDDRPRSALSVVHKLERIEHELPPEEWPERRDDSVSEMPTQAYPALPGSPSPTPPLRSSSAVEGPLHRARGWILFLAGALVALIVAVVASQLRDRQAEKPSPPVRVLVMKPEVSDPADKRLGMMAIGVLTWSLRSLGNLQGLTPLDPAFIAGHIDSISIREAANNTAAHKVLVSEIRADKETASIFLRLVSVKDGRTLPIEPINVPIDSWGSSLLREQIDSRIRKAFQEYPQRTDVASSAAQNADISEFLSIRQRIDSGNTREEDELDSLDRLIRNAPSFLEPRILATSLSCTLYRSTRNPADLERAQHFLKGARRLAPNDPRTLKAEFTVALESQQLNEARSILRHLESAALPGDPEVLYLHSRLENSQEHWAEAEKYLKSAIELAPSWRYIYWLVDLETKLGQVDEARGRINKLLDENPGNTWVLEQLAYLELIYGDLQVATQKYGDLANANPKSTYFNNLGLAWLFQGRLPEAEEAFQRAVKEEASATPLINLADTKRFLGDRKDAMTLYGVVLRQITSEHAGSSLSPRDELMMAQCLVHTGRIEEALQAVQRALKPGFQDAQIYEGVSQIYTVSGDLRQGLKYAQKALAGRLSRRWFDTPDFEPLRREPGFKALLESEQRTRPPAVEIKPTPTRP